MTKSTPENLELYEKVKQSIIRQYKPSAYRSGLIVKTYKKLGGRYLGNTKGPLNRWFREKWVNQRGEVGYKKKGDIYRPTHRIDDNTPLTWSELTKTEIRKAKLEKRNSGRIRKFRLKPKTP